MEIPGLIEKYFKFQPPSAPGVQESKSLLQSVFPIENATHLFKEGNDNVYANTEIVAPTAQRAYLTTSLVEQPCLITIPDRTLRDCPTTNSKITMNVMVNHTRQEYGARNLSIRNERIFSHHQNLKGASEENGAIDYQPIRNRNIFQHDSNDEDALFHNNPKSNLEHTSMVMIPLTTVISSTPMMRNFSALALEHGDKEGDNINSFEYILERPFPCKYCDQRFKQNAHRKSHELAVHRKARNFKCFVCLQVFGNKSNLKRHIRNRHDENLEMQLT